MIVMFVWEIADEIKLGFMDTVLMRDHELGFMWLIAILRFDSFSVVPAFESLTFDSFSEVPTVTPHI